MFLEQYFNKKENINESDLRSFLKNDIENQHVELKESVDDFKKNLLRPIIGFANTSGGLLILGINDKTKEIKGINKSELSRTKITNLIESYIEPHLPDYSIEIVNTKNGNIYLIDIPYTQNIHGMRATRSDGSIIYYYYERIIEETRQITPTEMNRLMEVKKYYLYNLDFRNLIISDIDSVFKDIADYLEITVDELKEHIKLHFGTDCDQDNQEYEDSEIVKIIKKTKLENLNEKIYFTIQHEHNTMFQFQNKGKYKELSIKEEETMKNYVNILRESLGTQNRRFQIERLQSFPHTNLYGDQDNNEIMKISSNLCLASFIRTRILPEIKYRTTDKQFKYILDKIREEVYGFKDFNYLVDTIKPICDNAGVNQDVGRIINGYLARFPIEFSLQILMLLSFGLDFRNAVQKALDR